MHYTQMRQAHILFFVKIETDGFYPFDFLFMSLKISDWDGDRFFRGERIQKSPRREGYSLFVFVRLFISSFFFFALLSLCNIKLLKD